MKHRKSDPGQVPTPIPYPVPKPYPLVRSERALAHRLRICLALERCYFHVPLSADSIEQAREEIPMILAQLCDQDAFALWVMLGYLLCVPLETHVLQIAAFVHQDFIGSP